MIECKNLNAKIPETTCIKRHEFLDLADNPERAKEPGVAVAKRNAYYYRAGCSGCKIGLELFNQSKGVKVEKVKETVEIKTCTKCGVPKNIDDFYKQAGGKYGRMGHCKMCHNKKVSEKKTNPTFQEKPVVNKPKVKPEIQEWAVCTSCGESKELNADNFHIRQNSKTGFTAACKECRNKRKRERRSLQGGNIPENCIMLDLTGHSNLHKKIKEWAGDNMRDVDKQILFHLKHDALGKRKAV